MDACHVLLGRLWMFDRKVFHDGRENTYEFSKDGQCYKLVPMPENGMDNNNNNSISNSNNKNMHNSSSRVMLCSTK